MHIDKYQGSRNETIRIMAVIAMTLDHIGAFLFPQYTILRIIGRFTMPVFSYGAAMGILKTKNEKKYIARLFIFALISQFPFYLVGAKGLSVISTIFVTVLFLYLIKKDKPIFYLLSLIPFIVSIIIPMDYGVYFLLLSTIIYVFRDRMLITFSMGSIVTLLVSFNYYNSPIQIYSIIGLFFVCFQNTKHMKSMLPKIRLNMYFFYIYYPLHLLILYMIKIF